MDRDAVLKLFQSEAETASLNKTHIRSQDTVLLLAEVIAHCSQHLSNEDFDSLVHIGGTLVKQGESQTRARTEVAATMKSFHDSAPSS